MREGKEGRSEERGEHLMGGGIEQWFLENVISGVFEHSVQLHVCVQKIINNNYGLYDP